MRLVVDASIVLPLIGFDTTEAGELRSWLDELLDQDPAHIIRNLTPLEVTSALRRLEAGGEIDPDHAVMVQRRIFGWPFVREEITQPLLERIWELRHNFTPYDASYLAVAEALTASILKTSHSSPPTARSHAPQQLPCRSRSSPLTVRDSL